MQILFVFSLMKNTKFKYFQIAWNFVFANKRKNKYSSSLGDTNTNMTKYLIGPPNTEIFKFLWYLLKPNFKP